MSTTLFIILYGYNLNILGVYPETMCVYSYQKQTLEIWLESGRKWIMMFILTNPAICKPSF